MRRFLVFGLAVLVFLCDQGSKHWAFNRLSLGREIVFIPRYFELVYTTNTGAAFGILQSSTLLLGFIALAAGVAIAVFVIRNGSALTLFQTIALGLTLGGACGNFLDRFRLRYVVDFIDVHLGAYQWPIFNIADSAICIGVLMFAIRYATQRSHDTHATMNTYIPSPGAEPSAGSTE